MSNFFRGLAQAGAWSCFDEFNRINIEVLSVIGEQFNCIKNALSAGDKRFDFEGLDIPLNPRVGCFITMNPGYAGRTELPDNLKALFRPISMMIPDYTLIAEIMLYSQGFQEAKRLSEKMTKLYKLSSEMLSQQDHYDFGMRALKSVLVMAGSLKRQNPEASEDATLIRAMRDSNLAKFLNEDIPLFNGIVSDLFPGFEIVDEQDQTIVKAAAEVLEKDLLQPHPYSLTKILQLYDAMRFRHGVMLVGPSCGGKTTTYRALAKTNELLSATNKNFRQARQHLLNPKSLEMAELYGMQDPETQEWRHGLVALLFNLCVECEEEIDQFIIFDGPVDALWIENMNTVLDDNKLLSLANSQRIKMTSFMHLIFEVQDLAVASPATVSRCAMVYVDPLGLTHIPFVETAMETRILQLLNNNQDLLSHFRMLIELSIAQGIQFVNDNCKRGNVYVPMNLVYSFFHLYECVLSEAKDQEEITLPEVGGEPDLKKALACVFAFAYVWGFGGIVESSVRLAFDSFARDTFSPLNMLPSRGTLYDYKYRVKTREWVMWSELLPPFSINQSEDEENKKPIKFHSLLVPTVDTARFSFLFQMLLRNGKHVFVRGLSGVGKSVIIQQAMKELDESGKFYLLPLVFSAHTTSPYTQEMIEGKLEKKRGVGLLPPHNKQGVLFIDDLNMPERDYYGSQPPIELLRQLVECGGLYERPGLAWNDIKNLTLIGAGGPDGGGRNPLSPRYLRWMFNLEIPAPEGPTLRLIFESILTPFFSTFNDGVKNQVTKLVLASIDVYQNVLQNFLPTPDKSHYVFNLRDLANVAQGVMRARPDYVTNALTLHKLWVHENSRVYHDRLATPEDRKQFRDVIGATLKKKLASDLAADEYFEGPNIFCDYLRGLGLPDSDRIYEESATFDKARKVLEDEYTDYQIMKRTQDPMLFFNDAVQHVSRITRILRQPRGHALLVGVPGTGKRTVARYAAFISDCDLVEIEVGDNYKIENFKEDLAGFYQKCGVGGKRLAFVISDNQLINDEFLEILNNVLNTGEIPNLFAQEDMDRICNDVVQYAKSIGENESRDNLIKVFYERVRENFHICLTMSPVGSSFRHHCRMFPSLVTCCTINWVDTWPEEALRLVAHSRFDEISVPAIEDFSGKLSTLSVFIHSNVIATAETMKMSMKRIYYVTPALFIRFVSYYQRLLGSRQTRHSNAKNRLEGGVKRLIMANQLVEKMQVFLSELQPKLETKAKETEVMIAQITKDQIEADRVKGIVSEEEKVVSKQALEAEEMAAEAQKELDAVLPLLEEATNQLKGLSRSAVAEVRQYADPHIAVRTVMECVCILAEVEATWKSAVTLVSDPMFINKISNKYGPDKHVSVEILKKVQPYVEDNPNFRPEEVGRVSYAAKQLCMWATILYKFEVTYRQVEPKQRRVEEAKKALAQAKAALKAKQDELARIEAALANLKKQFEEKEQEKKQLEANIHDTEVKLARAAKLTVGLADEQVRWAQQVQQLEESVIFIPGDSFLCAAILVYLGPFPSDLRNSLMEKISNEIRKYNIPMTEPFNFSDSMVDPSVVRDWQTYGLPSDSTSVENALIVTQSPKSSLMIDPQNQASVWIRGMEKEELIVVKPNTPNLYRTIENAVRLGQPVLLEDVSENLDPALDNLLSRNTYTQDGKAMVRIGDKAVDFDDNFKLYVVTKLANPLLMPDMFVRVSVVNFIVTPTALEAQQLSLVVSLERPELEKQKYELVMSIAADKKTLHDIEDRLLELLRTSGERILDDERLIETVDNAKKLSIEVNIRVKKSEETEITINQLRLEYKTVAIRASTLFFVTSDMSMIDPMYQYSLEFFRDLVTQCIQEAPESEDHLGTLINNITESTYVTVSRGLFEIHRQLFAFSMCSAILRVAGTMTLQEWDTFIRGPPILECPEANPLPNLIADSKWNELYSLGKVMPSFENITTKINSDLQSFSDFVSSDSVDIPAHLGNSLKLLEKILFIKAVALDRLCYFIQTFIEENLGVEFTRSPQFDLKQSFKSTRPATPLLFILSQGADPRDSLRRFAEEMGMADSLKTRSLGQGQGPEAEKAIQNGLVKGEWVFLQNCHLSLSWLPELEAIVSKFGSSECHANFRLFLSSMPTDGFPVSILRNSVKVTNEPPRGLRAHLYRLMSTISTELYESCSKPTPWKKLLFAIAFFHGIIQERKKFGSLGFNKVYEWTENDFEVSTKYLKMFLDEQATIPWDALRFLTGEIIYGGRITDDWDRRCMMSILKKYYCLQEIEEGYFFSKLPTYYPPPAESISKTIEYIESLPFDDNYEVFGMHSNAEISYRRKTSEKLVRTLQSTGGSASAAGASNDAVLAVVRDLQGRIPLLRANSNMHESLLQETEEGALDPLTVILKQELDRFRGLLQLVSSSLKELEKALSGLVAMSPLLEDIFSSLYVNRVPEGWLKYPSMKPLSSWFSDLLKRIDFFNDWIRAGSPISFWLSAFYFPQSFFTGILQRHSRLHKIPIDNLSVECEVLDVEPKKWPEVGVYAHGLIFDGSKWDQEGHCISEQAPGQIYSEGPWFHLIPTDNNTQQTESFYQCPTYITAAREGVLSTTGTSTNFVVALPLPTKESPDYWIQRGAALLLGTPE